jgi:hypothetical protein
MAPKLVPIAIQTEWLNVKMSPNVKKPNTATHYWEEYSG